VTLVTHGAGFRQAVIRPAGDGIRLLLNLRDDLPAIPAGVTADAIALLLLRAAAAIRYVRPCASMGTEELGFDVRLPRPALHLLDHALAALSLAARQCACEVEALATDARLARAFAAGRGLDI
jgi:hypothetical protein